MLSQAGKAPIHSLIQGSCETNANSISNAKDNQPPRDKETQPVSHSETDGFIGIQRKRNNTKRYFISGIDEKVGAELVSRYLNNRGVFFTLLKVFNSKRKGTVSAKLHVSLEDSKKIVEKGFWPNFVSCRPWLLKARLEKNNESRWDDRHGNQVAGYVNTESGTWV